MNWEQTASLENDYIFRYRIHEANNKEGGKCNSRLDLVKKHLQSILDIVIPCSGDSEIRIDGFKLMNDRSLIHGLYDQDNESAASSGRKILESPLFREAMRESGGGERNGQGSSFRSIKNAALYEPTVEYIQRLLQGLLDLVELESHGKIVKVDAFRLKDLSQWVEESSCDPADMLGYLATRCNCNCVFCYNKGCPPSLALTNPSKSPDEEFREVQTRLKYFYPEKKKNLFTSLGSSFEAFIHPHFREVLQEVRKKSDKLIRITTNGSTLTEEMIDYLLGFNPLHLDVALHSSSTHRRQRLMHDKTPEIAIKSLPLLRKAGIPYNIVIVPWPDGSPEEMLDDMEKTIDYADENDAHLVEISLPGYSKYFSERELFDHDFTWEAIARKVKDIRYKYQVPIVIRPAMYEERLFCNQKNLPEVIGIVKGSPGSDSSLQPGDILTKIGSNVIHNRPQARTLLSILQKNEIESVAIEVLRKGRTLDLLLNLNKTSYPYSRDIDTHLGIIFMGTGLRGGYLESLEYLIEKKGAKNILFLTSILIKPLLEKVMLESPFFRGRAIDIKVAVPPNRFLGGNICMGDLLVVQDYIDYIKDYINSTDVKPDLVVIPSSPFNLSGWGRDLTGRVYMDIERETEVPVEILECQTIYD